MQTISFMTANYVARPLGYRMTEGWIQGDNATQKHFKPVKTFAARFEAYLKDIHAMGFASLDLWVAILHPRWVTEDHLDIAHDLLKQYQLHVTSIAGGLGDTPDDFEATCELASALNTDVLAGTTPLLRRERQTVIATLQKYGIRFGIENHPEKTPDEILKQIGNGAGGVIGTAIDTGWYGTHGYNAAQAIEKLAGHIVYVHLKDVLKPGGHETCRYGQGCVPIQACAETLKRIGYQGGLCVEHEPEMVDPTEDCIANLAMLKEWLA